MPTKREQASDNDGMQHYYSTCPRCYCIVSDEQIVFVDGAKMCRVCMAEKAALQAALPPPSPSDGET